MRMDETRLLSTTSSRSSQNSDDTEYDNQRHSSVITSATPTSASDLHPSCLNHAMTRRSTSAIRRPSAPMDDTRVPNLAAKSLDLQTREVFNMLVSTVLFPATYAAFYKRVDQDIIAYVRDDRRAQCPAMEWAVRCYATWYFAKQHNDGAKLEESRYIYGVLLQYLQGLLDDPRRRLADVTFVVAVLLCMYEVFDGTAPGGWVAHIRGLKELLRQRGAGIHLKGFSRTVLLACRGFFVAEAFISQEACILAEAEWVEMNGKAFEREERAGRGSRFVGLLDQAYREIVHAPGLLAQARAVAGDQDEFKSSELRAQIQRTRTVLKRLRGRLACASGLNVTLAPVTPFQEALVDSQYLALIARYSLQGVCTVECLLEGACVMLDTDKAEIAVILPPRVRHSGREERSEIANETLDDILLSMDAMTIWTNQ